MAVTTYPIDQGGHGAKVTVRPNAGIEITPMSEGPPRGYTDFDEDIFDLEVRHFFVSTADFDSIIAYYEANKTGEHTINTELEGTYQAVFKNRPRVTESSGPYVKVLSEFVGVKV